MADSLLMIGTAKGLFLARSTDRVSWGLSQPHFLMNGVYAVAIDTRGASPRLFASATSEHWGPSVFHSDDLGATWAEPEQGAVAFPDDTGASLARVWQLHPSPSEPGVVWAGSEPQGLFRSDDGGEHFSFVRALWDHPHRPDWGAGFGGAAIHTVLPHPADPLRLLVAMSTGGVYRTQDAGASWSASNSGVKAQFFPDPWPEFGQCVHKVARDSQDPERLFLQNHHGVYRSDDDGRTWQSIADDLPTDFGFAMVTHPSRAGVAYNFPITADGERIPPGHACRVFRTDDAGKTWTPLSEGLPQDDYYGIVLRDAMCADDADPAGIYFGTRNGEVFASADEGERWSQVAAHLPDVLCVRAATVG
ncbi:MAG: glycosyl hydrolase [Pseudonocardiales bacterium]|nr:MAG: glycosyl hydrolase [Pseudonocardiales bacterium]